MKGFKNSSTQSAAANHSLIAFTPLKGGEVSTLGKQRFGAFKGVYLPTILNLLGLMMYLRQGWVVGNAGLLGALSIVVFCCVITGITAFAISSIITNIRIGSGGVFSLVSQSLGLQVGGSIGIPLFLVQALSAVLYMFGFIEAWEFVFPDHSRIWVTVGLCSALFLIAFIGANFAFRVQIFVAIIVVCALLSIFGGVFNHPVQPVAAVELWGKFEDASYWELFAIYFPAVTGIKVGASMSGSLRTPRKSIPTGTLFAWATATFVYIALCFWYAFMGTADVLRSNFLFSVKYAFISEWVILGIMCSCFTAALTSIVAAPRVLQALSSHNIFPFSKQFKPLKRGEPRNAFLATAVLISVILLAFRDINAIAPVITQFFIVIYFIINSVLVIETRLNLVSFRPQLRLPVWLPALGSIMALAAMIIISPILGLFSLICIALLYFYLSRKQLQTPWETVQSGLWAALGEWFMRWALRSGSAENRRIWKPAFLVPVTQVATLRNWYRLLAAILEPQGSLHVIQLERRTTPLHLLTRPFRAKHLRTPHKTAALASPLMNRVLNAFRTKGIHVMAASLTVPDYLSGLASVTALAQNFFPTPNSLFIPLREYSTTELNTIIAFTRKEHKAVVFFDSAQFSPTGREQEVVVWVRDQTPKWHLSLSMSNLDYAILLGYQLKKNWRARLRLVCAVKHADQQPYAEEYLQQLIALARLGENVSLHVTTVSFIDSLKLFSSADLHIIGLGAVVDKRELMRLSRSVRSACLFVKDSGAALESALV